MKYLKKPKKKSKENTENISKIVEEIIKNIEVDGDEALNFYTGKYDRSRRQSHIIEPAEVKSAYNFVDDKVIKALEFASNNIREFAKLQYDSIKSFDVELIKGVHLTQNIQPVGSTLCYIPGGRYPLLSTALMLPIPALVAGVNRVVATSPVVNGTNYVDPAILVAMDMAGVKEIYALGGAQAVAAFTYGTNTIKPVNLIVGPGNKYVSEAKKQCFGKVGIDFIAGPSEILIIADESANPHYIVSDLLAQSEHDLDASAMLVTTSSILAKNVKIAMDKKRATLRLTEVANLSWESNGGIVLVSSMEEAIEFSNEIAPEHLSIMVKEDSINLKDLKNYGSLFIGSNSPEVFGDYVTGPNHTLPTMGSAKYTGGLSVFNFLKIVTSQKVNVEALDLLIESAEILAEAEGLHMHKMAATIRR